MMDTTKDSFQFRVRNAVNGIYQPSMRRSIQSIALYEADRCLTYRYPQLRPFQKKWALFATAVELLRTLDFLNHYQRQEIMFRTNASKEPLAPDLAWRRMKLITREINSTIIPKAKELIALPENKDKSHDEICKQLLQCMYEESQKESDEKNKPHPPMWEFNHNNVFTVYRIYYRGLGLDPNIFPSIPPKVVEVPLRKPANLRQAANRAAGGGDGAPTLNLANMTINAGFGRSQPEVSEEERRAMLKEVKDHTELLKEFEGIVSEEELAQRKRALYAALPPVPPPFNPAVNSTGGGRKHKKKARVSAVPVPVPAIPPAADVTKAEAAATTPAATKPTAMEEEDWEKVTDGNDEEPTSSTAV